MTSVSGAMMAPRRLHNKKTTRGSDDDKEGEKDSKRRCTTTSITTTASFRKQEAATSNIINNLSSSQAVIPNHITFPTELNNIVAATTNTTNVVVDNSEPPTAVKISDALCKIVFCSRYEALRALDELNEWAYAENPELLNSFHVNDGSVKVLDFLMATMNDSNCEEPFRMKCIKKAVNVMMLVCFYGEDNSNEEIVTNIATSIVVYGGIDTLINASKECSNGDDVPQLTVLESVWGTLRNITCCKKGMKVTIGKEQAIILFNASIDMFVQFNPDDSPMASTVLENVFCTLNNLVRYHYVRKHIYDIHAVSKCLKDFRMGGNWSEGMTEAAIAFFNSCRLRKLLDQGDDYEMLLPFLAVVLKIFGSNELILTKILRIIHGACDTIDDQETIEGSGVMEPLVVLLASNDIDKSQKKKVRKVIINIFHCK